MAKVEMICAKQHFGGKRGELIKPGTKGVGEPDGVYWVAKNEKDLEVATPTAAELVKEARESEDIERLKALAEDDRKTVKDAALDRLAELDENEE